MARIKLQIGVVPTTPPAGWVYLYPKADGKLYSLDENGTETQLIAPTNNLFLNGIIDPTSLVGNDGDFYLNTASYNLFGPKISGAWGAGTSLIGPQGIQGLTGATGATGPQGPQGDTSFVTNLDGGSASSVYGGLLTQVDGGNA